jgi:putative nucleotidyltransferase with HDIG domain
MSTASRKRIRAGRVSSLELPPGRFARTLIYLQRGDVLARIGVALVGALAILGVTRSWQPPFPYREGYVPDRNIASKVAFRQPNARAWEEAKSRAFQQRPVVYRQDPKELVLLRAALQNAITEVVKTPKFADLTADLWKQFEPGANGKAPADDQQKSDFERFREAIGGIAELPVIEQGVAKAFAPLEQHGLLEKLPEEHGEGNQKEIAVYPVGRPQDEYLVQLSEVLLDDGSALHKRLKENLPPAVAERVFLWVRPRLHTSLTLDDEATRKAREAAAAAVPPQYTYFLDGQTLALADQPLGPAEIELLRLEHDTYVGQLPLAQMALRSAMVLALLAAMFGLCWHYVLYHDPRLILEMPRLVTLVASAVATVSLVHWASLDPWRADLIPLLLFGMTFAIAYNRDAALVLSVALAVILGMTSGQGLGGFIVGTGVVASAIDQLGRIRSRSKLIRVGSVSALVALALTFGIGLLNDQPPAWPLFDEACRNALWTLAAGFLITGLLPMIENFFGVLTEISLLEWGDVSHPLLQELVRRAPGTYNHSINVASIAEAASESIGACGLLARVGAYYHDIGKMLKPDYFVENQSPGSNRHDTLVPAMSTLIIIAHVKDGADLARQHDLPQPIIDFIEQHHGTTLVEYFYRRANERAEASAEGIELPESSFRYPGPKPQTIEAAVLMLADAVESASRALVEPTPARIESLVEDLALKKLLDGQFDECHLTLEQLRTIEDSLIKSLTAHYHGRIKYPSQQRTA